MRVITFADVQFSAKTQVKTKKKGHNVQGPWFVLKLPKILRGKMIWYVFTVYNAEKEDFGAFFGVLGGQMDKFFWLKMAKKGRMVSLRYGIYTYFFFIVIAYYQDYNYQVIIITKILMIIPLPITKIVYHNYQDPFIFRIDGGA